jgi:hypothetical protein
MMNMLGAFNHDAEREIIKERTKLGLARSRANGRIGGGRFKLTSKQQQQAIAWIRSGEKTQSEVAEFFSLDRSTVSRMMSDVLRKSKRKRGSCGASDRLSEFQVGGPQRTVAIGKVRRLSRGVASDGRCPTERKPRRSSDALEGEHQTTSGRQTGYNETGPWGAIMQFNKEALSYGNYTLAWATAV